MLRAVTLILSGLVAVAAGAADETLKAGVFSPPRLAPDFALQGSNGTELKLSSYRGKLVLLAFGFTTCPDVCPMTLATLAQARKKLGAEAKNVQVVYVTVDPERDDAARMRTYLASFDPTFIGGTGAAGRLEAVRKEYGIIATRKAVGTSYLYGHSSFIYLIDAAGRLRALMPYGHSADDYVHDLRILMARKL
jgi:protein SCO1/2